MCSGHNRLGAPAGGRLLEEYFLLRHRLNAAPIKVDDIAPPGVPSFDRRWSQFAWTSRVGLKRSLFLERHGCRLRKSLILGLFMFGEKRGNAKSAGCDRQCAQCAAMHTGANTTSSAGRFPTRSCQAVAAVRMQLRGAAVSVEETPGLGPRLRPAACS